MPLLSLMISSSVLFNMKLYSQEPYSVEDMGRTHHGAPFTSPSTTSRSMISELRITLRDLGTSARHVEVEIIVSVR